MLLIPLALAAPAPLGWTAVSAEWTITIRDEEPVRVSARYTLASSDARAGQLTLVGPELLVLNAPGPVVATPDGLGVSLNPDRSRLEQRIEGLYDPPSPGALSLAILPAARTHVTVIAPGLDVTIPGAVDGWLSPTDHLSLSWAPHLEGEPTHVRAVVQGESATTFRGDAGAIAVDTVLRWKVLRGEAQRFTFDAAGLEELDVAGENIASWERTGSTVTVRTLAPVKGIFAVTVRGRSPPGKGERVAPTPVPTGVNRVDRYVTLARSDEGELIPVGAPASLPLGRLPAWAKNLGDAAPLAAWNGAEPVRVIVATAEVIQGPGTVVTAARYTVAASRDGRLAVRMNLRVRNERRQYLHLVPPPGARWTPIVIRVGNQPKSWLSDGAGGIYVPLERSVETVRGPLSFPVDAEWIADGVPWDRKGEQNLVLPSVDAPVQAVTWELHLPRGYARVGAPRDGKEGFVLTDLRADEVEEERRRGEVVSSALQNAVGAYRKNDFEGAERWLQEAQREDTDNEEVAQLQANLDLLAGKASTNDVASRRVRDLAKAKNSDVADKQVSLEQEAEGLLRAGDLDAAAERYGEALAIANELQKTEQLESVEQKVKIEVAQQKLSEIAEKKSAKDSGSFGNDRAPMPTPDDDTGAVVDEEDGWEETEAPPAAEEPLLSLGYLDAEEEMAAPEAERASITTTSKSTSARSESGGGRRSAPASPKPSPRTSPKPPPMASSKPTQTPTPIVATAPPAVSEPAPQPALDLSADDSIAKQEVFAGEGEAPAEGQTLSKDFLTRIPAGRSYQEVVVQVSGGVAEGRGPRNGSGIERAASEDDTYMAPEKRDEAWSVVKGPKKKAKEEVMDAKKGEKKREADQEKNIPVAPPPPPAPPKPRVIERREPLVASPSPMALAMLLDGPAVSTRQALLPGATFPTWRLRYRRLPGESG
ncbi:MAG: hypothetical protein Q8P18_02795 [Pseudomonadota bacterium]|nr:hypothetical protein [Pseudomonadota bacterium]